MTASASVVGAGKADAPSFVPVLIRRALCVDDDPRVRRALSDSLSRYGVEVDTAEDAAAALELSRAKTYDLITVDYIMPRVDGLALIHELKARGMDAVFALVTGKQDFDLAVAALNSGVVSLLMLKPWSREVLDRCLAAAESICGTRVRRRVELSQAHDELATVRRALAAAEGGASPSGRLLWALAAAVMVGVSALLTLTTTRALREADRERISHSIQQTLLAAEHVGARQAVQQALTAGDASVLFITSRNAASELVATTNPEAYAAAAQPTEATAAQLEALRSIVDLDVRSFSEGGLAVDIGFIETAWRPPMMLAAPTVAAALVALLAGAAALTHHRRIKKA